MAKPLISVLIPCFNRASIIGETLDSILSQSYNKWECIIVDDRSNDNIQEILKEYLEDKRFYFIKKPKNILKGANVSRNYALELARGEFVYWLDSDDIIHPRMFELCMKGSLLLQDSIH